MHPVWLNLLSCRFCLKNSSRYIRSSGPEVFLRKGVLKPCSKFTGEQPCLSVISIKFQRNFIEITLRHGCSLVIFLHIFRTPFRKNTLDGFFWRLVGTDPLLAFYHQIIIKLCSGCFQEHFSLSSFIIYLTFYLWKL